MDLQKGQVVDNRTLMDVFKCACEGGIRYSSRTQTIVLVINHTKEGRANLLENGQVMFAGRPEKEDGSLTGANRRLAGFLKEDGKIYLFEVFKPGRYEYRGEVEAAGDIKWEWDGTGREYPVFPLRFKA